MINNGNNMPDHCADLVALFRNILVSVASANETCLGTLDGSVGNARKHACHSSEFKSN